MRKYLAGFLVLALGVGIAGTSSAVDVVDQELAGPKVKPNKLNKKKFKKASTTVRTTLPGIEDGDEIPQKATQVNIAFPKKDMKFDPKKTKGTCTTSLEGTDRTQALDACEDAKVSVDKNSFATAALPLGPGGTASNFDAEVMAFNGGFTNARANASAKTSNFVLWSRVTDLEITTILPSVLTGKNVLKVTVPLLAGGTAAITDFQAEVKKGKYVQARCKSNAKKLKITGKFTFLDAPKQTVKSSSKIKKCNKKK